MIDWASSIKVPVFLSGALQDEQTGPQWPALIDAIPKTTPLYVNMVNGNHIDSADPQTISRWLEFLDLYVADEVPTQPSALGAVFLDEFASVASGIAGAAPLPAIRFTQAPDLATARADFAANTPKIQVLFDNGAGSIGAGHIESTYSAGFSSWPPAGQISTLYLGADSLLHTTDPDVHSDIDLHPRSCGEARHQPVARRQCMGGRSGLGLDTGSRRRRHCLPDPAVPSGHHHRGARHPRPLGPIGDAGGGLPGHHHRGPADC